MGRWFKSPLKFRKGALIPELGSWHRLLRGNGIHREFLRKNNLWPKRENKEHLREEKVPVPRLEWGRGGPREVRAFIFIAEWGCQGQEAGVALVALRGSLALGLYTEDDGKVSSISVCFPWGQEEPCRVDKEISFSGAWTGYREVIDARVQSNGEEAASRKWKKQARRFHLLKDVSSSFVNKYQQA